MTTHPEQSASISNASYTITRSTLNSPNCKLLSLTDFNEILTWHRIAMDTNDPNFITIINDYDAGVKIPYPIYNEDDILKYKNSNCENTYVKFEYDYDGMLAITPVVNKEVAESTHTISLIKAFSLLFMAQPSAGNDDLQFIVYPGKVNYKIEGRLYPNKNVVIIGLIHNGRSLGLYNISIPPTTNMTPQKD
jgi:hypothetical protein